MKNNKCRQIIYNSVLKCLNESFGNESEMVYNEYKLGDENGTFMIKK